MSQLALDKSTNDLYKPTGGGVTRVTEGRFVVQQVQSKLKTILGEWILDSRIGFINRFDFKKNYRINELEDRARILILKTKGVRSITFLGSTYKDRVLEIQFTAITEYGVIDSTVPWDNTGSQVGV